ncbi:hypothetical protein TNCV_4255221 [Trichonephila clavipes]|nr:hypothetical protein TNCV_4255221 [Trichonephila clavipes]
MRIHDTFICFQSSFGVAAEVTFWVRHLSHAFEGNRRKEWSGEDAIKVLEAGASAIIVSNHGGRELDGTIPTVRKPIYCSREVKHKT